jgi:hypothetical protein
MAEPGGLSEMVLSWVESDPERSVVYAIHESDNCYGPFDKLVAVVHSHDAYYTSDNIHYSLETSAPYERMYYYRMSVVNEAPEASAYQTNAYFQPTPVGAPAGLQAQVSDNGDDTGTVTLSWNPGTGTTDGYYVYRSLGWGMGDCNSVKEYLGTVTEPSFIDDSAPLAFTLYYRVRAFNSTTSSDLSNEVEILAAPPVAVDDKETPLRTALRLVGPNPAITTTKVAYSLATPASVRLYVYNVAGRLVRELVNEHKKPGLYSVEWDGSDSGGRRAAGVYFVRLSVDGRPSFDEKLVLIR